MITMTWIQTRIVFFAFIIHTVWCCSSKTDVEVSNPHQLVPNGHPQRMLGWEQMLLMFEDPLVSSHHVIDTIIVITRSLKQVHIYY